MGIQPIDLQTMYSQLSNVSKSMAGAQQAQLTEAMQQQVNIQKSMEKAKTVHETSNEQSMASEVNQNGSNSSSFANNKDKDKDKDKPDAQEFEHTHNKDDLPYLGTLIDISR